MVHVPASWSFEMDANPARTTGAAVAREPIATMHQKHTTNEDNAGRVNTITGGNTPEPHGVFQHRRQEIFTAYVFARRPQYLTRIEALRSAQLRM